MQHFDLVVVGAGSGNSIVGKEYSGLSVAIIESGPFGGTCLNVGCIPTKMYVYPADVAEAARRAGELGVARERRPVDWRAMRDRIFGRIDRELGRRPDVPGRSEMAEHDGVVGHGPVHRAQGDDGRPEQRRLVEMSPPTCS